MIDNCKYLMLPLLCIIVQSATAQITIDDCIALAKKNYPIYKEHELTRQEEEYNLKNNSMQWMPQLSVNAKINYQSEVVEMPLTVPGYELDISHYQYGATADISQMIWDGGASRNNKKMIKANSNIKQSQIDVTLYNINERVENLYLGILLIDKQIEQNNVLMENLVRKQKEVQACIENGVAYKNDIDIVNVNILNCKQQKEELISNRDSYMKMLSKLVGKDLCNEKLIEPGVNTEITDLEIRRPEIQLYDAQLKQADIQKEGLRTRFYPKFNFSIQGGVGRPGLNMLKDEIQPYYLAGIKMQWNLGELYSYKNDKKKIHLQKKEITFEKETFILNTSLDITEQINTIKRIKKTLMMDNEIISMRKRIRVTGEEQYASGIIKMTDLMSMIDDEHNANLNKSVHEVQLMMAIRKLNNIKGKK